MVSLEVKFDEKDALKIISELEKMNVVIESDLVEKLKNDPLYFERKKELKELVERIKKGKEPLYEWDEFENEIDKLFEKLENENHKNP